MPENSESKFSLEEWHKLSGLLNKMYREQEEYVAKGGKFYLDMNHAPSRKFAEFLSGKRRIPELEAMMDEFTEQEIIEYEAPVTAAEVPNIAQKMEEKIGTYTEDHIEYGQGWWTFHDPETGTEVTTWTGWWKKRIDGILYGDVVRLYHPGGEEPNYALKSHLEKVVLRSARESIALITHTGGVPLELPTENPADTGQVPPTPTESPARPTDDSGADPHPLDG